MGKGVYQVAYEIFPYFILVFYFLTIYFFKILQPVYIIVLLPMAFAFLLISLKTVKIKGINLTKKDREKGFFYLLLTIFFVFYTLYFTQHSTLVIAASHIVVPDTTPPTGSISINDGDAYTNSLSVTLNLSCSDPSGCSQMRISNIFADLPTAPIEPYTSSKSWTLEAGADGTRAVFVVYRDGALNWMPVATAVADTIDYDATLPTSTITSPPSGSSFSSSFSVSVSDSDTGGSGLKTCYYHVFDSAAGWTRSWATRTCSSSFTVTVGPTGDCQTVGGTCSVYAFAEDNALNIGASDIKSYNIVASDTTPPESRSVSINGGATYTTSTSVSLGISCSDSGSGMKDYRYDCGSGWSSWVSCTGCTATQACTLLSGDGSKTATIECRDNANNVGSASDTIILDTTPPTGSISINSGAAYTNSLSVTLTLSCSDPSGCSEMRISNTIADLGTAPIESYVSSKSWTLAAGADGTRAVFVVYRDGAGNWGSVADTIDLDTTKPYSDITTTPPTWLTSNLGLSVTDSDTGSGVSTCSYHVCDNNPSCTWTQLNAARTCSSSFTVTVGSTGDCKTQGSNKCQIQVLATDVAGNTGDITISGDNFITTNVDYTPPTGSVSINGGAAYTSSTSVTLSLSCSDARGCTHMNISNTLADLSTATIEAYTSSKAWTLLSGDGTKTVYVVYRDGAGNWGSAVADTIDLVVSVPPSLISPTSNALLYSTTPTLSWSPVTGAGVYQYAYESPVFTYGTSTTTSTSVSIPVGAHFWKVRACTDSTLAVCGPWSSGDWANVGEFGNSNLQGTVTANASFAKLGDPLSITVTGTVSSPRYVGALGLASTTFGTDDRVWKYCYCDLSFAGDPYSLCGTGVCGYGTSPCTNIVNDPTTGKPISCSNTWGVTASSGDQVSSDSFFRYPGVVYDFGPTGDTETASGNILYTADTDPECTTSICAKVNFKECDLDPDCVSLGKTCGPPLSTFPNRSAQCDNPTNDPTGPNTYTCSICGPCNTNPDCETNYCCDRDTILPTPIRGSGQCFPASATSTRVYNQKYLCTTS